MKIFFIPLLFLISNISYAQKITTLTCVDNINSNFQFNISFNELSKEVFWGDTLHRNAINNNLITYTDVINGSTYKTIIYRDTGKFTVFVTGNSTFNFSGLCSKKSSNKF